MQHTLRPIGQPRRVSLMAGAITLAIAGLAVAQVVSPPTQPSEGHAPVVSTATIDYSGSGPQGTVLPGDVLTATYAVSDPDGDAPDLSATDLTIQWMADGVAVGSPGSKTYTVRPEDAGKTITFSLVPHTDASKSNPSQGQVTIAADVNTNAAVSTGDGDRVLGVSISGNAIVGTALTATPDCIVACGSDIAYQWQIEDAIGSGTYADITGATSGTYTPVKEEQKRNLKVIATRDQDVVDSATKLVGGRAPVVSSATITYTGAGPQGTALPGDLLTATYVVTDPDGDTPDLTATGRTVQWMADNVAVGTAGSGTYTLRPEDAGKTITFTVVPHTDPSNTDPAQGQLTRAIDVSPGGAISIGAGDRVLAVAISGNAVVGTALTATPTCIVTCGSDIAYQWQVESAVGSGSYTNITGANSATYTPTKDEQKRNLRVVATGEQDVVNSATKIVSGRAPTVTSATIEYTGSGPLGMPLPGDVLTAAYGVSDPDGDATDTTATDGTIQWRVDNVDVGTAGNKTYTVRPEDAGKTITFRLVPHTDASKTDPAQGLQVTSADLGTGGALSIGASGLLLGVTVSDDPIVGTSLTATPSCIITCGSNITYQWQIEDAVGSGSYTNIAGATSATYTPVKDQQKRNLKVVATQAAAP